MKARFLQTGLLFGVAVLAGCSGPAPVAEAPLPTPTAIPLTIGGSPLDAVDALLEEQRAADAAEAAAQGALQPDAIDCQVHAEDASMCEGAFAPEGDGLQAVLFDSSLWDFEMDGFQVFTNVTEPYPIEDVIADSVEAARAEFVGENQALFPYLANRRTAPKYAEVGIWSATFLFAGDPVSEPAEVKIAVEGTTADGEKFDDLITFRWQWTEERWVPEWESLMPESSGITQSPVDSADSTDLVPDSTSDSTADSGSNSIDLPPLGASFCPPGFPYAHHNGLCYANPINPSDQIGGPQVTVEHWELFRDDN